MSMTKELPLWHADKTRTKDEMPAQIWRLFGTAAIIRKDAHWRVHAAISGICFSNNTEVPKLRTTRHEAVVTEIGSQPLNETNDTTKGC